MHLLRLKLLCPSPPQSLTVALWAAFFGLLVLSGVQGASVEDLDEDLYEQEELEDAAAASFNTRDWVGKFDQKFEAFLDWAAQSGIQWQDKFEIVNTTGKGIGLKARRGLRSGELLVAVPRKLLISSESAASSQIGEIFRNEGFAGCKQGPNAKKEIEPECMALMSVHLLKERADPSSAWYPWLQALPRKLGTPIHWDDDEFDHLQGSNLYGIVEGWKGAIRDGYKAVIPKLRKKYPDMFPQAVFSQKEYAWAYCTIFGRAFDIDVPVSGGRQRMRVMGPVADLFNHGEVKSSYQFNALKNQFDLFTQQTYSAGQEVFLNYDPKNNADYLVQYGFILEDNPHDYVGMIASIGQDAPYFKEKNRLLNKLGFKMDDSHKLSMNGLTNKSLDCIRLLCAEEDEVVNGDVNKLLKRGGKLSDKNELCVHKTMVSAIDAMLAKYPTKVYEDDAMLKGAKVEGNVRNAVMLRRDEKRILIVNLSRFQRLLSLAKRRTGDQDEDEL